MIRSRWPTDMLHPHTRRALALLLVLLAAACLSTAHATTYLPKGPQQLALDADLIFVGTVGEQSSDFDADLLWTDVTFDVEELLLDRDSETQQGDDEVALEPLERVTLRFLGGSSGGQRLTVSGLAAYQRGERYLIFAYQRAGLASPLVGVRQGSWNVAADGVKDADGAYLTLRDPGGLQRAASAADSADLESILTALKALLSAGVTSESPPSEASARPGDKDSAAPADTEPAETEPAESEPVDDQASSSEPADEEPAEQPVQNEPADEAALDAPEPEIRTAVDEQDSEAAPVSVLYRVDESGGPLGLTEAVGAAATKWQQAAPGLLSFNAAEGEGSEETLPAANRIRYGTPLLLGPDAMSLTLAHEGEGATEVLISPDVGRALPQVLLHELGVLAGLPEGTDGIMSFGLDLNIVEPTPNDVNALLARRDFAPEDLNRDGVVDFYDLVAFGQAYGKTGLNLASDFNGDGRVDDYDLAILESAYTFTPPSEQAPSSDD